MNSQNDKAFQEYVALSMLVYRDGGVDALNWWLAVTNNGTYEQRLERGRYTWANWKAMWVNE